VAREVADGVFLGKAATPQGMRLYAIGDIHGCDDELAEVHERIAGDLSASPLRDHRIVHIGDYVDRGQASREVLERLSAMAAEDHNAIFLRGNHDQVLLDFLDDPALHADLYLSDNIGGMETLRSYGVAANRLGILPRGAARLAADLRKRMPADHLRFLQGLRTWVQFGDFVFVHAGIRPGVAMEEQDPEDLIWIREEFLFDGSDYGAVIVHGHTSVSAPEVLPNRINIDTGAVFGGPLTCLVLEGTDYRFL
jgi:serine/threonine protein phosphatase 1